MKTFMIILFVIVAVAWLLWLIGFPIYKNVLRKSLYGVHVMHWFFVVWHLL